MSRTYQFLPLKFFFLYPTRMESSPARKSMLRRQNIAALLNAASQAPAQFHPGGTIQPKRRAAFCARGANGLLNRVKAVGNRNRSRFLAFDALSAANPFPLRR